ncbi:MAG: P1 family peptidase [Pseudomonadota bacterium]
MTKPRARELGLDFPGVTGKHNAITDVEGVTVGCCTLRNDEKGIRTGVTAIVPRQDKNNPTPVLAGQFTLNGNGEMTGTHWINDAGYYLGPICITNTHAVGVVHHACVQWMIQRYSEAFSNDHIWAMPVVAETYDGELNDINGMHVTAEHALNALESASGGKIAEGNIGGGTGMICYGFKGGTGTASRRIETGNERYTLGALVQANHGTRGWLSVLGVPVGQHLLDENVAKNERGSIIAILATDAPLSPLALRHLARRAALGVGRGGTPGGNSSGDIFLAFSTANAHAMYKASTQPQSFTFVSESELDNYYLAAVESVEESVINALLAAEDMPTFKPAGAVCRAIDHAELQNVMRRYGRMTTG